MEAVKFGFFTDEEVRKHSVVKVTSANLCHEGGILPVEGGLYDKAMGPIPVDQNRMEM